MKYLLLVTLRASSLQIKLKDKVPYSYISIILTTNCRKHLFFFAEAFWLSGIHFFAVTPRCALKNAFRKK